MANPMDTYVPDTQYKGVLIKVAETPTVEQLRASYEQQKRSMALKKSLQQYAQSEGITQYQPQPKSPNWLEQGLDYISRPLQAITGGISHAMKGEDFFSGMGEGIQGMGDAKNVSELLAQAGTGDLGELNVGPFSIKGRDALGFIGDIALDPTTYLGAGLGKGIAVGAKAIGATRGIEGIATVAPRIAKITDASQVAKNVSHTSLATVIGKIPILKNSVKLITPINVDRGPIKNAIAIWEHQKAQIDNNILGVVRTELDLGNMGNVFEFTDRAGNTLKKGKVGDFIALTDTEGNRTIQSAGDVFANIENLRQGKLISDTQYAYSRKINDTIKEYSDWAKSEGVNIGNAKNISAESGVEYFPRTVTGTSKPLAPTEYNPWGIAQKIGKEQSYQKNRTFATQTEGVSKGYSYLRPDEAILKYVKNINQSVADQQFAKQLIDSGAVIQKDIAGLKTIQANASAIRSQYEAIRTVRDVYSKARTMGKVSAADLKKMQEFAQYNPELKSLVNDLSKAITFNPMTAIKTVKKMYKGDLEKTAELRKIANNMRLAPEKWNIKGEASELSTWSQGEDIMESTTKKIFDNDYVNSVLDAVERRDSELAANLREAMIGTIKATNKDRMASINAGYDKINAMLGETGRETRNKAGEIIRPASEPTMLRQQMARYATEAKDFRAAEKAKIAGTEGIDAISAKQPALKNMYLNPQDAKELASYLADTPDKVIKALGRFGQASRVATVGSDFGGILIQGLVHLSTDPKNWAKNSALSIAASLKPDILQKALSNPEIIEFLKRHPGIGISGEVGEPFEIAGQLEKLGKLKGPVGKVTGAGTNVLKRFQTSYETFGTLARIDMARALEPVWAKSGKSMSTLDDFVNQATGFMSTKALGVSATQRELENGFLFFAPRYLRASLALVADAATDTGLKGAQSRRSLITMMGAGMAMYKHVADMTGQEPILDPSDGRFMTLQVGDDRVGIGAIWTSLARLVGNVVEEPESLGKGLPWEPDEWNENPLLMWIRSRGAPLTTTAIDLLSGESYLGEPINDWGSLAKYGASKFMPFAAESSMPWQTPPVGLVAKPFEMVGMRTFPQGFQDRRQMELEKLTGDKTKFADADPFIAAQATKNTQALGLPIKGEDNQKRSEIFSNQDVAMQKVYSQLMNGELTKAQYRTARNAIKAQTSAELGFIEKDETPEQRAKRMSELNPKEQARQKYYELLRTKDEYGNTDWLRADAFLAMQSDEVQKYIDDVSAARMKTLPPGIAAVELELFQARKTLRPYFELFDVELSKRGMLKKYYDMTPAQQDAFMKSDAGKSINKTVTKSKENMRRSNSKIDKALVEWYGLTPISKQK